MLVLMAPLPKSSRVRGSVSTLSLFHWDSGTISCRTNRQYAVKEFCNLALHRFGFEERIQSKIAILPKHKTSVTVDQRLYSFRGGWWWWKWKVLTCWRCSMLPRGLATRREIFRLSTTTCTLDTPAIHVSTTHLLSWYIDTSTIGKKTQTYLWITNGRLS